MCKVKELRKVRQSKEKIFFFSESNHDHTGIAETSLCQKPSIVKIKLTKFLINKSKNENLYLTKIVSVNQYYHTSKFSPVFA